MARTTLLATLALTLLVPAAAIADTPAPQPLPAEPAPARSPRTALVVASASTVAGLALTAVVFPVVSGAADAPTTTAAYAGLGVALTGPSMGHVYAGEYRRAAITTGLRAGGVAAIVGGMEMISFDDETGNTELGMTLAAVGAGTIVATTIYDLYDAPRAARRTNARAVTVTPVAGVGMTGLSVAGRF